MSRRRRPNSTRSFSQPGAPGSTDAVPVMRARSTGDLLGCVPALLGFHPQRSLVAVAVHETRLGFRLRVDLPEAERADDAAAQVAAPLLAQRPDGVLLVVYVDPEPPGVRGSARLAADAIVDGLRARLAGEGVPVHEAVRFDGARYWSYLCDDAGCCPADGTPYEVESSPMLANAVFNGVEVLPDRDTLVRRFGPVSGRRRAQMQAAADRAVSGLLASAGCDSAEASTQPVGDRVGCAGYGRLLRAGAEDVRLRLADLGDRAGYDPEDDDAALLGFCSMLVPVRDLAWSYIEPGNARTHLAVWTSVAQRAVPPFEAGALCLAGFAAWLSGDGSQARCAVERARAADPEHSMARLLERLLDGFVPPDAWRPFDREQVLAQIHAADDDPVSSDEGDGHAE